MDIHLYLHSDNTMQEILYNTEILVSKVDDLIAAEAIESADIVTLQTAITDVATRVTALQEGNATVVAALQAQVDAGNASLQPALDAALANNAAIEASVGAITAIAPSTPPVA